MGLGEEEELCEVSSRNVFVNVLGTLGVCQGRGNKLSEIL